MGSDAGSEEPAATIAPAHREAELRLRLALDATDIGVWEYDLGGGKLSWDERVREVAEAEEGGELSWEADFLPILHPEDRQAVVMAFQRLVEEGDGGSLSVECRIVGRRSGRTTWAALEGRALQSGTSGLRVIGTARDVTAQRQATEDLHRYSEQLERRVAEVISERQLWVDMFDQSDDPVAAVDPDLRITAMNRAYAESFRRLFGAELQIGESLKDALAHMPQARDVSMTLWGRALSGEVVEIPRSREAGPDGAYYDIKFRPMRDREGRIVGAFQYSRDVTQRVRANERVREAQEVLQRAQKMEALGQLTGGVAHDFNNLLQVIGGSLDLLARETAGNARAERRINNALAAVSRGAKLASQLLAFGRRQPLEPKVVNLGRFIHGMDEMLRRALGEEIELETVVSGGLWNTMVDPGQIENAILNLAINARDAMAGRGHLTVEAGNVALDDEYARQNAEVKPGQYVMVAVTDTGSGMSPEVIARAFEPFFSTKEEGKGTGLGLSMVYGLVKQLAGHAKIYSEAGSGTTIKLYLPRAMQGEDLLAVQSSGPVSGGSETILVVEDDDEVRDTAVSLLAELGYNVLRAPEAASALAIVESGVAIDLLFTDVVMPGPLRSPDLARMARERLPDIGVLFTSGYTQNSIVHGGRLDPGLELLSKPYTREALARKIRHVLGNRAQDRGPAPSPPAPGQAPQRRPGMTVLLVEDDDVIRASTAAMIAELGHAVIARGDGASAMEALRTHAIDVLMTDRGLPGLSGDELAREALTETPNLSVIFATGAAVAVPDPGLRAIYLIKPYGLADVSQALEQAFSRLQQVDGLRP